MGQECERVRIALPLKYRSEGFQFLWRDREAAAVRLRPDWVRDARADDRPRLTITAQGGGKCKLGW